MGYPTKIATCCYCGTRAALVLRGKDRHELSCSGCGAPLHDLKSLRKDKSGEREALRDRSSDRVRAEKVRKPKTSKKKRPARRFAKFLDEAFDVIEDIFD